MSRTPSAIIYPFMAQKSPSFCALIDYSKGTLWFFSLRDRGRGAGEEAREAGEAGDGAAARRWEDFLPSQPSYSTAWRTLLKRLLLHFFLSLDSRFYVLVFSLVFSFLGFYLLILCFSLSFFFLCFNKHCRESTDTHFPLHFLGLLYNLYLFYLFDNLFTYLFIYWCTDFFSVFC